MNPGQANWNGAKENADCAPNNAGQAICAPQPKIGINWRDHNFDRFRKGATPLLSQDLTITSTGDKVLSSISLTLTGEHFKVEGALPGSLQPGATATVKIIFDPKKYEEQTATIRVTSDAVNENPIDVTVKGKLYSVITFIVEEEKGSAKLENVKLKIKQKDQPEEEVTTGVDGKVEFETEKEGDFEVQLGDWTTSVLEFRSLTTA
jgi:hypothetical protein